MRSKRAPKRSFTPDPVYHHGLVTQLINQIMRDGKKTVAQKQVYKALELVKQESDQDALTTLLAALDNIKPQMEVRPRRIGGAAYQVPTPVRGERQNSLAIRWLITAAENRSSKDYHTFAQKMAAEIKDALSNAGGAVKKKLDTHRMAEANKAFAHFRW